MIMKGRPLAKAGYEQELSSIRGFIAMQNRADSTGGTVVPTTADKVTRWAADKVLIRWTLF
jgi:hypothetical protein